MLARRTVVDPDAHIFQVRIFKMPSLLSSWMVSILKTEPEWRAVGSSWRGGAQQFDSMPPTPASTTDSTLFESVGNIPEARRLRRIQDISFAQPSPYLPELALFTSDTSPFTANSCNQHRPYATSTVCYEVIGEGLVCPGIVKRGLKSSHL
ncbi:hypothetical protein PM082_001801 [Marasmius tenuissimus]|nr:hypothetical protein PM082_001801 [Marasmius tenuissimus]